jgi:hypothetical protein
LDRDDHLYFLKSINYYSSTINLSDNNLFSLLFHVKKDFRRFSFSISALDGKDLSSSEEGDKKAQQQQQRCPNGRHKKLLWLLLLAPFVYIPRSKILKHGEAKN